MSYFEKGDVVRVHRDNDNDCYNSFRNKDLRIDKVSCNVQEHPGYDDTMEGMPLYDLVDMEGNLIPCSLYFYELEGI